MAIKSPKKKTTAKASAKKTASKAPASKTKTAASKGASKSKAPDLKARIMVGMSTCGRAAGARVVFDHLVALLKEKKIKANVEQTGCIGMCSKEVLVDIQIEGRTRVLYGNLKTAKKAHEKALGKIVDSHILEGVVCEDYLLGQIRPTNGEKPYPDTPYYEELSFNSSQERIVLRNCGSMDPESVDEYCEREGYQALSKALTKMAPEDVVEEVKKSGLRGRGGAGFPTGLKWGFAAAAKADSKYMICNADEGDPGAFMDRSVLEGDPHSVLEGMIIGGYAMGANTGYIYVRAEYPLAVQRLNIAIEQAHKKGYLGKNILGSGFDFEIHIMQGAGAFVCGEETALIASIEGKRGMPRPKPPFPAQQGLWGNPTNINNVETLANIAPIILRGGVWYAGFGTEKSKGTKVFALAGKISNPGLVEVPMGTRLREIIYAIGGGCPGGKKFKAVQTGGPSGGCIPESLIDTPVEYESLAKAGAIMGSGGMVVMDEDTCMVEMARYFLHFTQDESCGKCVPCRIGTKRMLEILERIVEGKGEYGDEELLKDLGEDIKASSLCGLGQTAPNPVLSTLRYFQDEYDAHIKEKRCPAGVCKALFQYKVVDPFCKMCGLCARKCPVGAIKGKKKQLAKIIDDKCTKCGVCIEICPFDAITQVDAHEKVEV
jgi:NADH:ubiquinone oxidoreductase subunit F (NADH-binding)/Pyruvate/2-oxoacid:ferredoxin oxidoreductase delta subunit/(2Fe-2S) ferredoxin